MRRVLLMALGLLFPLCAVAQGTASDEKSVPEYVLWIGGNAPGRAQHEISVIRQALERTRHSFGPYRLVISDDPSKASQWRQHLARGEIMHIVPTSYTDFPPDEIKLIPVPIAGGKLGYRNLVVLKERLSEFGQIDSHAELSGYTAGQGASWPDMWVYEANELPIRGANGLPDLFALLREGNIDYIPLGVEETESILELHSGEGAELAVVPELMIYYPLSSFPVVSNQHPELASRLQAGLEAMHADGSLPSDEASKPRRCRVINLENPSRMFPLL
ncbi:transporter substrate-binding domain-containing protein [Gilvimarinus xylanilyticus]|uniref:Transporter substrate-binding domain-containing protein n=1 Tax=Gilvimarinus xylanilyticus TaxID=2944139 RepID=A0A9X2KX54_9GAMM|nr:transporter substrate-binding domain-containing protein [Gilvimarinus xylanilyticus]MCP8900855.1 transporter substrate-binding domain-containing protein [Gilvimarinus xylanilyticus]